MIQELLASALQIVLFAGAGGCLAAVLLAAMADAVAIARRPRLRQAVARLRKPRQPAVTVLVYAQDDADVIEGCLRSLYRNSYHNYDVVVVDNVSRDETRRIVRRFLRTHPRVPSRLYAKRTRVSTDRALADAYRKSAKGEYVLTLSAASRPSRLFLKSAAAHLQQRERVGGLAVPVACSAPLTLASIIPEQLRTVRRVATKGLALLYLHYGRRGLNGIYRRAFWQANARGQLGYADGLRLPAVASSVRVPRVPSRLAGAAAMCLALLLMTYSLAAAAQLITATPLLLGWLLVMVGSVVLAWSDDGSTVGRKAELTFAAPLSYFLAYGGMLLFLLETLWWATGARWRSYEPGVLKRLRWRTVS